MAGLVAMLTLALASAAQAAGITVNTTADSPVGTLECAGAAGDCSLRQAIDRAASGDTIGFAVTGTIALAHGELVIPGKDLTIGGPGAGQLTIDAGGASRIFFVNPGYGGSAPANVSLSGLTLSHGHAGDAGSPTPAGFGGGIFYQGTGTLALDHMVLSADSAGGSNLDGSSASGFGGAIEASRPQSTLTVANSSFTGDSAGGPGAATANSGTGFGGAIHSFGQVTVTASTFSADTAGGSLGTGEGSGSGYGGAIEVQLGALTVIASSFDGDTAGGGNGLGGGGNGAGGALDAYGPLSVSDSTFATNTAGGGAGSLNSGSAQGYGGAIAAQGAPFTITGSAFSANVAGAPSTDPIGSVEGSGGAVYTTQPTSITNATFVANRSEEGGALALFSPTDAPSTLTDVTIDHNVEDGFALEGARSVTARSVIVSANVGVDQFVATTGIGNCDAHVASSDHSLEGPAPYTECGFDLTSADPLLAPLADNGGPTQTQALQTGSPAIDAVPAASCPATIDQRGLPRPDSAGTSCDVGAYETQGS